MKRSAIRLGVLIVAVMFAFAASGARVIDEQTISPAKATATLQRANTLIGMSVQDSTGQKIGTIEDLVLDNSLNNVTHAVFSHRAARGEGISHYAIPFDVLSMNTSGNAVILDVNASDLHGAEDINWQVSERWFQGPIDVESERDLAASRGLWRDNRYRYSPAAEELEATGKPFGPPVRDIYGRPLEGRARTPYVQNVYRESSKGQSRFPSDQYTYGDENLRGYERDQYGRPVYERDYYTRDTYGHNGYSVTEDTWRAPSDNVYGRPIDRDPWRGTINENTWNNPRVYGRPMDRSVQRDWRWGDGLRTRPMTRDYDYSDQYGRPIYRDYDVNYYDQYGRPVYKSDTYMDPYGRPMEKKEAYRDTRGMGAWFRTDWNADAGQLGLRRVSSLMGTDFQASGRDAGNIDDLVIDMREGHVAYAVVALADDFAGATNKVAAIPWQAVDLNVGQRFASVDISRNQLLRLAFTPNNMPDLSDMSYARRLHEQFDVSPYWEVLGYVEPTATDEQITGSAWKADSDYIKAFDPDAVTTFSGSIESISTFKPSADASAGVRLRIRTDDGKLMLVNAGPVSFMRQQGITFDSGDRVTVTGSRVQLGGQNVILASQLKKGDQTVQLRTRQGQPVW